MLHIPCPLQLFDFTIAHAYMTKIARNLDSLNLQDCRIMVRRTAFKNGHHASIGNEVQLKATTGKYQISLELLFDIRFHINLRLAF